MSALVGSLDWLVLVWAMIVGVVRQSLRPMTWRRPVRAEFWRFMELVCVRNLPAMTVAAALVGLGLVGQGLYWLDQFGQAESVSAVIIFVVVREIGPLIVGLLTLGTGGIVLFGELSAMRRGGQLDVLDSQGIDPFLLMVVPRVGAMVVSLFTHTILFIVIALSVGYVMALSVGALNVSVGEFFATMLTQIGSLGYLIVPAKALAFGLTIGAVCSLEAVRSTRASEAGESAVATSFMRSVSGILLVSALISLSV